MKTTLINENKKSKSIKLLAMVLIIALVLSLGVGTALAGAPATSIHVFGAPSATTVQLDYDGSLINMEKQGNHWKTPDDGEYYSDDIVGVWIDAVWWPKASLDVGVEASGTLNVWLGELETYTIDTTVVNGTITPDESGIPAGADRTINYNNAPGFYLLSVTVDGSPVNIGTYPSSYSFSDIQDDHTVVVVYEAIIVEEGTFTIDTTVVGGTIDPDESGIAEGSDRTINYSPAAGNFLVSVTVDGNPVSIVTFQNSYTFSNITSDHTIVVVYRENVVTDTNTNLLLILSGILVLAGGALVVLSRVRKRVNG